jgi:isopentenyl-diphosphate delta-isomerase
METTNQRKSEVIDAIRADPETDRRRGYFDAVRLRHRALPEVDLARVDTGTRFLGKRVSFPLILSSMTGGDEDRLRLVNRHLAAAAEREGVAMGVGSQRVMFTHPAARDSFALRPFAPSAPLMANLGAVQLNYGFDLGECLRAVEVLQADALCLHLNPLQEAVQPEGNTNFEGLADRIGSIAERLPVPVVIKEVGAGLAPEDVALLAARGVRFFDIAGAGGTSWSRIEHHRQAARGGHNAGLAFQDWGLPTPEALRALRPWRGRATLIASGGIRSGIDMAKALALGASMCGAAAPFLEAALRSAEAVAAVIEDFRRAFRTAMFLAGAATVADLEGHEERLWSA